MKKLVLLILLIMFGTSLCNALEAKKGNPGQLFYAANQYYERGEYQKAIEEYGKILDTGLVSGNLYFNMANAYFKTGKLGYAILNYERARRLLPRDSDIKSNLAYARSLAGGVGIGSENRTFLFRVLHTLLKSFDLNAIAISCAILYFIVALFLTAFLINTNFRHRLFLPFLFVLVLFLYNLGAFAARYYDEVLLKHGIVLARDADCMYEPIEKSVIFYRLHEGDEVLVLKTRNGWRQVKRADGKRGWVKKENVEEI